MGWSTGGYVWAGLLEVRYGLVYWRLGMGWSIGG